MRATRYLAKLYDMPAAHGEITAFDSYASHLYVGTTKGTILHFSIEGIPEYTTKTHGHAQQAHRSHAVPLTEPPSQEESVFTSLLSCVLVSDQRRPVQLLQHSRTQALLFVLCDHRLSIWRTAVDDRSAASSGGTEAGLTFLSEIGKSIGTFFVSPIPSSPQASSQLSPDPLSPSPAGRSTQSGAAGESHRRSPSGYSGTGSSGAGRPQRSWCNPISGVARNAGVMCPGDGEAPFTSTLEATGQVICAAEHKGRSLLLYEFNAFVANREGGSTVPPRAVLKQEFLLPEPALCLVIVNPETVCVGLRQEYVLLSLKTGASRSILRLGAGRSAPLPLLALGEDGEVHMRYHLSVFSASLKGVGGPGARAPAEISPGEPQQDMAVSRQAASTSSGSGAAATSQPPDASQVARKPASGFSTFRILGRTVHMEDDVELIVSRHPFLFAFTDQYCDVFTAYEDEAIERLPLSGCRYASQLAKGGTLFTANKGAVWMARLHPLRTQLADLVSGVKVDEAFQLLASQRTRTGRRFDELELELHLMAGFTHLYHCRPAEAMHHFGAHVDPRDLALHLPECLPPSPSSYSSGLRKLLEKRETQESDVTIRIKGSNDDTASDITLHSLRDDDATSGGYWAGWTGACPYNSCTKREELLRVWLETFESCPFVPSAAAGATSDSSLVMLRHVPYVGPVSATYFLERSWESLKDAVVAHFEAQLAADGICRASRRPLEDVELRDSTLTESASSGVPISAEDDSEPPEGAARRRAMCFALLVLALERQDRRAAYRVVNREGGLYIADCYDLLCHLREYRLLALLLFRHGFIAEAQKLTQLRLRLDKSLTTGSAEAGSAAAQLPAGLRRQIEQTLFGPPSTRVPDSIHTVSYTATTEDGKETALATFSVDHTAAPTRLAFLAGSPHTESQSVSGTPWMMVPAPGDFAEVFYLVETMDLSGLKAALLESPVLSRCRDSDGCTPLHHVFALLSLLHGGEAPAPLHNALFSQPHSADVDAVLLQFVLSAASMLVGFGCPVTAVAYATGASCLDVAARVCSGAMLDIIVASLLSAVEVNAVCHDALGSVAA